MARLDDAVQWGRNFAWLDIERVSLARGRRMADGSFMRFLLGFLVMTGSARADLEPGHAAPCGEDAPATGRQFRSTNTRRVCERRPTTHAIAAPGDPRSHRRAYLSRISAIHQEE